MRSRDEFVQRHGTRVFVTGLAVSTIDFVGTLESESLVLVLARNRPHLENRLLDREVAGTIFKLNMGYMHIHKGSYVCTWDAQE